MSRFGKVRRKVSALLILGGLLIGVTSAQANMRFFSLVRQICTTYKLSVSHDQMKLEAPDSDNASFHMVLQSRRNNLEQTMAIGYIAAGQAIARTGLGVKTIKITVVIPKADHMRIWTEADVTMVDQMRLGKITASEFMRKLDWN